MSKRKRIPSPFDRILPVITRTFGPRLVLIGVGAAALLILFTGGSYILSKVSVSPKAPIHLTYKKVAQPALPKAQVLGAATTSSEPTNVAPPTAADSQASPVPAQAQSAPREATNTTAPNSTRKSDENNSQNAAGDNQDSNNAASAHADTSVQLGTPLGSFSLTMPLGL